MNSTKPGMTKCNKKHDEAPPATQTSRLLLLPPELRNMIYHDVALSTKEIGIHVRSRKSATIIASHPLLFVSHQLRKEFGPVLIDTGLVFAEHYHCTMQAWNLEKLCEIADSLKSSRLRSVSASAHEGKQLNMSITLGRKPDRSLSKVLERTRSSVASKDLISNPFRFADVFSLGDVYVKTNFRLRQLSRDQKLDAMMAMNELALTWSDIVPELGKADEKAVAWRMAKEAALKLRKAFTSCYREYIEV